MHHRQPFLPLSLDDDGSPLSPSLKGWIVRVALSQPAANDFRDEEAEGEIMAFETKLLLSVYLDGLTIPN